MTVNQRQYRMFYGGAASILCGLFYAFSFPPFNLWVLVFPSLFFFYKTLLQERNPFMFGFIFATISYGIVLYGIKSIGYEAWIPLTIFMGLMYGIFGRLFQYASKKMNNNVFILISLWDSRDTTWFRIYLLVSWKHNINYKYLSKACVLINFIKDFYADMFHNNI